VKEKEKKKPHLERKDEKNSEQLAPFEFLCKVYPLLI
jgi:hypothetical protein